jgi:hypothetical protein
MVKLLQILGVEVSLDRMKYKVIWSIYHDLFINDYTKYFIIKLSLLKKYYLIILQQEN